MELTNILKQIEEYCSTHDINHRFVGGVSFGGLLNEHTTYHIDKKKRIITLSQHNKLTLLRSDGSTKDIDMILFCPEKDTLLAFKSFLLQMEKEVLDKKGVFPVISFENAIYPQASQRNVILQFVSALEVDVDNHVFLTFDDLRQEISWESLQPWKVILNDQDKLSFMVRNPIADFYAYYFRSPGGLKPKDELKIKYLGTLAIDLLTKNSDYQTLYKPWQEFIKQLEKTTHSRIQLKILITKLYWQTVGTTLAHGKGGIGIITRSLMNQFTGVRQ